jgi:hypothetical protein
VAAWSVAHVHDFSESIGRMVVAAVALFLRILGRRLCEAGAEMLIYI